MICTNWSCPLHACMSPECQLEQVAQNNPHIIVKYGADIAGSCPNRKELVAIKKAACVNHHIHAKPHYENPTVIVTFCAHLSQGRGGNSTDEPATERVI